MWSGDFVFGEMWAGYRGPAYDTSEHAHLALQIALGISVPVQIEDQGSMLSASSVMIRPRVRHRLVSSGEEVLLIFIEPQSNLGRALIHTMGSAAICIAPSPVADTLQMAQPLQNTMAQLVISLVDPIPYHDDRVATAIRILANEPGPQAIHKAAVTVGLSPSRLRALTRAETGAPLSQWLLWKKLEHAARAISAGASLAEAAHAGGFADQPHFSRTMRRMFGLTPGAAAIALR
ncbi:MAG TPA: helix-turn-helix domain-containing protein [Alphaproteobacteria bacterium]|nr:helix-turn-helix domain-containing protein [Alphaproteobacteria bacterium]